MTTMSKIHNKFTELYSEVTATRYVLGTKPTPADVWNMATLLTIEDLRNEQDSNTEDS